MKTKKDNPHQVDAVVSTHDIAFYQFALRLATAIDELKSSHAYFIMQKAFGEIAWHEVEEILQPIMKCNCVKCKKIKAEVRNNLECT